MKKPDAAELSTTDVFTLKQVAEKWQVSIRTVQRLVTTGKIKAIRLGRSVRIPADEVERIATFGTE